MQDEIQNLEFAPPSFRNADWRWRTAGQGEIRPRDMETRHLFYTLRMIWNHTMPREMNVGRNIRRYSFGASHPPEFIKEAIIHIGQELAGRDDLSNWQKEELAEMAAHFRSKIAEPKTAILDQNQTTDFQGIKL